MIKENPIRKSNELPNGFSLWQEKDDGFMGLKPNFIRFGLKPGVGLSFVVIPPAEAGGNSAGEWYGITYS